MLLTDCFLCSVLTLWFFLSLAQCSVRYVLCVCICNEWVLRTEDLVRRVRYDSLFDVSCLNWWMWLIHWIFHMKQVLVFLMHWFGMYAVICRLCNEKVGVIQIQCFLGSVDCAC